MSKLSTPISFPYSNNCKSFAISVYDFSLEHILNDHIIPDMKVWIARTALEESVIRDCNKTPIKSNTKCNFYLQLRNMLLFTIQRAADYPLYILVTQKITKSSSTQKKRISIFLAKEGYIVFADAKQTKYTVKTAYFPQEEINNLDDNYDVFIKAFTHLKRKYIKGKVINDIKYNKKREITACSFITCESWKYAPSAKLFSKMM